MHISLPPVKKRELTEFIYYMYAIRILITKLVLRQNVLRFIKLRWKYEVTWAWTKY